MLNKRGRNGGGELKVSVSSDEDNVIISISDTGYGIPREHQEKIFEPFFTTKSTGSGLGLPICLEIVRQHGGSINFKSQEGEWTMFTLYLPSEKKRRLSIK
jgi:signal transduction histidine kinase